MQEYEVNITDSLQSVIEESLPVSSSGLIYTDTYTIVPVYSYEDLALNFTMIDSAALFFLIIGACFYHQILRVIKSIIGSLIGGRK